MKCAGKKVFPSEMVARFRAMKAEEKYGKEQRSYLCLFCGFWHITTQTEKRDKHEYRR